MLDWTTGSSGAIAVADRAALDQGDRGGDDTDGDEAGADGVDVLGRQDLLTDEREQETEDEGDKTENEMDVGVHDGAPWDADETAVGPEVNLTPTPASPTRPLHNAPFVRPCAP